MLQLDVLSSLSFRVDHSAQLISQRTGYAQCAVQAAGATYEKWRAVEERKMAVRDAAILPGLPK